MRLPDEFRTLSKKEKQAFYRKYNEVLDIASVGETTSEHLLNELKQNSITHIVVHTEYEFGEDVRKLNDQLATFVNAHPQLSGFGTAFYFFAFS